MATPKEPTQDTFAQWVSDGIRKAGATCEIVYDPERFSLSQADKDGTVMFLANAYQEYCSAAESIRPRIIQRFVRSWFIGAIALPESFEDLHPDLLPIVRTRYYFDLTRTNAGRGTVLPHQVLGEHLGIGLVYDLPQAMRSITQDNLDGWGVTFYEAMEAARHNLIQLQHAFIGPTQGEGVYLCVANDGYASSRLILLDVIRQLRVAGDPVAMVSNPETLIVAGSEDTDGLKGMLRLATNALQQPRPISGMAVRLDGDEWMPWLPDPSHAFFNEFRGLQLQSFARDYDQQKEVLDGTTDKDTFVASFSIVQHPETGDFMTYCVWPKDTLTLLPHTDRIAFMQEGKGPLLAEWDRVVEVMGELVTPMGIYPERLRVSGFPTDEQFKAMGATTL
jgi:uncharacterized protein YtpQ (UPF0354 family)